MKRNIDIQKEWEAIGAGFDSHIASPSFKIPDNYFAHFPEEMRTIVSLQEDSVLTVTKENPYFIPQDYFAGLEGELMAKVKALSHIINNTSIEGLPKKNPFSIPEQYFETFPEMVWARINAEEDVDMELATSPLLSSLKKSNPFETPELNIPIPAKPVTETAAKPNNPVPMVVKKRLQWAKWSAAASIAVFFILGATWLQMDKMDNQPANSLSASPANANNNTMKLLASIPEQDIANYVSQHADEFDEFTLEANLASVPAAVQTKNLESSLQDISDEDIEAYLNTN